MKKYGKIIWIGLGALIIVFLAGMGIYLSNYYHASPKVYEIMEEDFENIQVLEEKNEEISFVPENPKAGIILYPGGKVAYESYVPFLKECADQGILAVVVHMPGNLAFFDMDAADKIREEYKDIKEWYLVGHSLGGVAAASYISDHVDDYEGIIFLASYSTEDLSQSGLKVLSIYGTEDEVLGMESYEENKSNLPEDAKELVIEGGCHCQFGDYGEQKGDGEADISSQDQVKQTVDAIADMISEEF